MEPAKPVSDGIIVKLEENKCPYTLSMSVESNCLVINVSEDDSVPSINYSSPNTNQSILSNSTKKTNMNFNSNPPNEMDSLNVNSLNNIKSNSTHSLIKTNNLYTDDNKNLTIHNGITPGNFETDGKKNLLKVMHKLDQIIKSYA